MSQRRIFVPQLDHKKEVAPILKTHRYKLPDNVRSPVSRWHRGVYYGYGNSHSWVPLNTMGGMATKAFHAVSVRFPERIDKKLRTLLKEKQEKKQ